MSINKIEATFIYDFIFVCGAMMIILQHRNIQKKFKKTILIMMVCNVTLDKDVNSARSKSLASCIEATLI